MLQRILSIILAMNLYIWVLTDQGRARLLIFKQRYIWDYIHTGGGGSYVCFEHIRCT